MICRKCANMFDDSLSSCPECGTPTFIEEKEESDGKGKEKFKLNIPEEEIEKPIVITAESKTAEEPEKEETKTEKPEIMQANSEKEQKKDPDAPKIKKAGSSEKKAKKRKEKSSGDIGDKSAAALIILIVCILASMMTVLTFVSVKSDVFEGDDAIKTVALSTLSADETSDLEQWMNKVSFVSDTEFDCSHYTVSDFLSLMNPYDAGGLYGSFYGKAEKVTDTADPAHRYEDENGEYAYYKIPEEEIDSMVKLFGLTVNHTVNTEDCYYYGGYYYFRDKADFVPAETKLTDVKSSRRIQDGSYYIRCSFHLQDNLSSEAGERYAIVKKAEGETETDANWVLQKLSSEPIFDQSGTMIKSEGEISFKIKTHVIEHSASDGTVYHRYVVEYPEFSGVSLGEQTANQLFNDMITSFELSESSVQQDYERYVKYGGDVDELPLITHVVSRVTYNSEEYISVIEETSNYIPSSMPPEDAQELSENGEYEPESEEDSDEPVPLPVLTVEGYNFDVETGDFVNKDAVIGKDYLTISELLYRLYNGYGYNDIIDQLNEKAAEANQNDGTDELTQGQEGESTEEPEPEEVETEEPEQEEAEPEEIPEDEEGLGKKIYDSANALCHSGYMFCFVTEEGYARDVVIPFDMPHLFTAEFSELTE